MRVIVKKWGNSASVRIPAAIMQAARIALDTPVDVREEDGRIIIEPDREPEFNLDSLLDQISDDNRHDEFGPGEPLGKEAF